jgi:hypothetical protein
MSCTLQEVVFRVMYAERVLDADRAKYELDNNRTIFHFDDYDSSATLRQMMTHTRHSAEKAAECKTTNTDHIRCIRCAPYLSVCAVLCSPQTFRCVKFIRR